MLIHLVNWIEDMEENAVSEEAKVVQRATHILAGKKGSLAASKKGNVMERAEILVAGKKKSSVVGGLVIFVMERK